MLTGVDVISKAMKSNSNLTSGFVDPLADLRILVDGETGGEKNGERDDYA